MTSADLFIPCVRGTTLGPIVITCQDSSNNPINLTGWTPYSQAKDSIGGTVLIDLSPSVTDAIHGQVTILKNPTDTAKIPKIGMFVWDLIFKKTTGEVLGPYLGGSFKVSDKVSDVTS